tara:strand:- start:163 stop:549 length:387 start_codon:yes stop_codon:yes gene_type:complete
MKKGSKLLKIIKDIYINRPWIAAFLGPIIIVLIGGLPLLMWGLLYQTNINIQKYDFYDNVAIILSLLWGFCILIMPFVWLFVGVFISKRKFPYILSFTMGLAFIALFWVITGELEKEFSSIGKNLFLG